MRTFLDYFKRRGFFLCRRGGLLLLAAALLACAWNLAVPAYGAQGQDEESYDYLFEVTTGAKTNDEDKINFFIITYTTQYSNGRTVSKFLFPAKDGWDETYKKVSAASDAQAQRDRAAIATYGYKGADLEGGKEIFQAFSTDQYIFNTQEKIREIKRVQAFAGDGGSWDCRAFRVYSIDKLDGLFRANIGSEDCYINFEGDLLAEGAKATGANVAWQNDKLITTGLDLTLTTSGFDEARAHHPLQDSANSKTLAIRFDFADVYGGGLEAQGAMSATNNTLSNMGLAETMVLTLYYVDSYGMQHQANIPAILNAADYTSGLLPEGDRNKPIGGFGLQGESIVVGVYLPDFAYLVPSEGIKVTLGAEEIKEVSGVTKVSGSPAGQAGVQRENRIKLSEEDDASFVTMAVYDLATTTVEAHVDETVGAIRYTFTGDPIYYQPVSSLSGTPLAVGTNKVGLTAYESGNNLAPRDRTERYLFEITTDSVTGAGTRDNILMSVSWTDLNGNIKTSENLSLRELARDFNGWWYGASDLVAAGKVGMEDIGYYLGVSTGRTLRFFLPLQQVKSINEVRVWMSDSGNHDDWQMKDLTISTVNSFERRAVSWEGLNVDGITTPVFFDRVVEGTKVYSFQEFYDNAAQAVLVQQGADETTNVGPTRRDNVKNGVDVIGDNRIDWSQLRYAMSFQQASQDLGFNRQRYLYAVTVNVGGNDQASAEDGDCGSKNLFYFRLIFKNGSSSFVLANQQLASDGFIAGASQTFYIGTNQDYGDVTAVQIIPEDLDDKSDMFDKLKIDSIDVKRQSNAALLPVWSVSQVGWISIDYRDNGQMQSTTGMAGREASELSRTYLVDSSTFDVNFMLSITTDEYNPGEPQFQGNLSAVVYYDSYSPSKGYAEIADVTKSMYSYMNRTPIGTPDSVGGKTISDPNLMFRANHTDRFYFSLSDVRSVKRIELLPISAVNCEWKISDVSLYIVNGEGNLILNQFGEYQQIYDAEEQLTKLASGDSESSPPYHQILQAYDGTTNSSGKKVNDRAAVIRVTFTENEVEITPEAKQWTSVISKEPVSDNDTLNVYVYPMDGTRVGADQNVVTTIQYTNSKSDQPVQKSTGNMSRALYKDQPVFYATGINASAMKTLAPVMLYTTGGYGIEGSFRAFVQQVRSGVVINSWDLSGTGYTGTDVGVSLGRDGKINTKRQQRVQLQLSADTKTTVLSADKEDIAVSIWYRGDNPSGMELRSPYIFLTDQGYDKIGPGQVINLTFDQKNVGEITGVTLVAVGDTRATVELARVVDEEVGTTRDEVGELLDEVVETYGDYGFNTPAAVSGIPSRMSPRGIVTPVTLTFTTGEPAQGENEGGGTDAPVRVTLGYYNQYGDQVTRSFENIQHYLVDSDKKFTKGSTRTAELLVEDLQQMRWIELEPRYSDAAETATWTLASIGAAVGDGGAPKDRTVNATIREGAPMTVVFANISLKLTATTVVTEEVTVKETVDGVEKEVTKEQEETTTKETIGGEESILTKSGGVVTISPELTGSTSGWRAVAERVVDGFPASASSTIRINRDGDVEFTAPENKTGASIQYRVTITSIESPDVKAVINIGVESDPVPVASPAQPESGDSAGGSGSGSSGGSGFSDSDRSSAGESGQSGSTGSSGGSESGSDSAGAENGGSDASGTEDAGSSGDSGSGDSGSGDSGSDDSGSGDSGSDDSGSDDSGSDDSGSGGEG